MAEGDEVFYPDLGECWEGTKRGSEPSERVAMWCALATPAEAAKCEGRAVVMTDFAGHAMTVEEFEVRHSKIIRTFEPTSA